MTSKVRRTINVLWICCILNSLSLIFISCMPPTSIVTTPGKIALAADQVAVRVNELQAAAIQANANSALDQPTTKIIVEFTVSADKVLSATPTGWEATVVKLWQEASPKIHTTNPTVQFAITALTGLLGAL